MNKVMEKAPVQRAESTAPISRGWMALDSLRTEVDRLFKDFEHGTWRMPERLQVFDMEPFWGGVPGRGMVPPVDVVEDEKGYTVTVELPGLDDKDVEVKQVEHMLILRGEKKVEHRKDEKGLYLAERRYGMFERTLRIPEGVNLDRIEAGFKNGVLKVAMPKLPATKRYEKRIAVKTA
ncbi:MAG: Hsp20/alpha crystallin family protein [Alphaproteobacteria bacterium]